jgi:co-chaperonin GroES (HSP10)
MPRTPWRCVRATPATIQKNSGDSAMNNGGDILASGRSATAQFGGAQGITDLEQDFAFLTMEAVCNKYALSQAEYDQYAAMRLDGKHLPDLPPVGLETELGVGFSVTDHRKDYSANPEVKKEEPKKFPEPKYGTARPILDRILVMRISDDPDVELLEDGSTRSRKSGLVTAAKYRQHSNVGIVLAAGGFVVLGGLRVPMEEIVKPKCKVCFGEYNAENFPMDKAKAEALCDSLGINYIDDQQGLRLVRVQDVRTVEWPNDQSL